MAQIETALLETADARLRLLNLGCVTQSWSLSNWTQHRSAVLGYANVEDYRANPHYLGAIIGRVANRIAGAEFTLNGKRHTIDANEGNNTLHGGAGGISHRVWSMERDGTRAAQFKLRSADGDQGFPGQVDFTVTISLTGQTVTYDMMAKVDRPTPINMTQHNYYNLNGKATIAGHSQQIPSDLFLATDAQGVPTQQMDVSQTTLDFRKLAPLHCKTAFGIDSHFCLQTDKPTKILLTNNKDCELEMQTTQPGVQVYTSSKLPEVAAPSSGQTHAPFCGICIEPQGYPNAVNRPDFPSIIVTPDAPYRHHLSVTLHDKVAS